ncbi:lantibiotic dehydratase [Chitinophaga sp. 30R24]|uniref:lantibiotic dehydratase n=1 Tax=Chitinophaga sp. 30R24 TaxID=3248838 RepID=UPI003B918752
MSLLSTYGFYLLRTPLLSCEEVWQLHCNTRSGETSFIQAIRDKYTRPLLQEAIFLASPVLYDEMMKWLEQPADERLKLPMALYRYLLRMSTRCTPYGLFAGCSNGRIYSSATTLLPPAENSRRKLARLDIEYLSALTEDLLQHPDIRQQVLFFPNNSIYPSGTSCRYYEYREQNKERHYFLSAFSQQAYLMELLQAAAQGARISELITHLCIQGFPEVEATAFIDSLIENQLLVAGWAPAITGADMLTTLISQLQACPPAMDYVAPLREVQRLLAANTGVQCYQDIKKILTTHFPRITVKDPVQVDLFFEPATADLSEQVTGILTAGMAKLAVLGEKGTPIDLQTFKEQFLQRYELREIPLMTALDSDTGIGYGVVAGAAASYTPLIDDLVMPAMKKDTATNWNVQTQFMLQRFLTAQQQQAMEIRLTEADLDELAAAGDAPVLPPYLSLMGSLIASDAAAADKGDFRFVLKSCSGPNALALLGRFAAGNATLAASLKSFAQMEQAMAKDRIIAEIVHLPEGRVGNVLLRPSIYDYEIPFLGKSSVAEAFQLQLSDLLVSVRNNQVVLRSARLGKEILPRLTSAHNFSHGLAVYRFLCDLQQQQAIAIHWNWNFLPEQPFLPRVVYQQIILERARWHISSTSFLELLQELPPAAALQRLREQHRIPVQVLMAEGDNELPLDLDHPLAASLLTDKLKKGAVVLYEQLYNNTTGLLANEHGVFCNEMILPLYNTSYQPPAETAFFPQTVDVQRSFPPGSEWVYVKIYGGPKWLDKLLVKEIAPLVSQWQANGITDHWFFIRYQDPAPHLRVRFHLPDPQQGHILLQQLKSALQSYQDNDIIQQLQLDTYIRELERYGALAMELSETFFYQDSQAAVALLAATGGVETPERWLLALKGADELLNGAGYTLSRKLELVRHLQQEFFKEHRGDADLQWQLNNKYRQQAKVVAAWLDYNVHEHTPDNAEVPALLRSTTGVFSARTAAIRDIFHQLTMIQPLMVTELPAHYLHMFLNRMFTANARLHELVVYHYLMKYYVSQKARNKEGEL